MPDMNMREAESLPVQLTRMEGTINLIKYQNDDMVKRVSHLETSVVRIESKVQKLELEAEQREDSAVALAAALRQADNDYRERAASRWTPLKRLYLLVGVIYAGLLTYGLLQP